jgi:hypothetical protein
MGGTIEISTTITLAEGWAVTFPTHRGKNGLEAGLHGNLFVARGRQFHWLFLSGVWGLLPKRDAGLIRKRNQKKQRTT